MNAPTTGHETDLLAYAQRVAAQFPPLTAEQTRALAALLPVTGVVRR